MGRRHVGDLAVYRRSVALADEVHGAVRRWPALDVWTVGVQLLRAADSVGANMAEAFGRERDPDRRRLLFAARGSACELEHWLNRAPARGLPVPDGSMQRAQEVGRMLNGLIRALSD